MDTFSEKDIEAEFADGQTNRDLRYEPGAAKMDLQLDSENPQLEALRQDDGGERYRRIKLPAASARQGGAESGGGSRLSRVGWRLALAAAALAAICAAAPSAWNYLQS